MLFWIPRVILTKGKSSKKIMFEEMDDLNGCLQVFAGSLDVLRGVLKRFKKFKKPIAFFDTCWIFQNWKIEFWSENSTVYTYLSFVRTYAYMM
jgi:hypothetical protein